MIRDEVTQSIAYSSSITAPWTRPTALSVLPIRSPINDAVSAYRTPSIKPMHCSSSHRRSATLAKNVSELPSSNCIMYVFYTPATTSSQRQSNELNYSCQYTSLLTLRLAININLFLQFSTRIWHPSLGYVQTIESSFLVGLDLWNYAWGPVARADVCTDIVSWRLR